MGSSSERPDTVENIQALRGIAALCVVWAHLKLPLRTLCPQALDYPLIHTAFGAIGVDVFFIISGYVICLTACKHHYHSLEFFLGRIARVAPLYLVITIPLLRPGMPLCTIWNGIFYLPIFDRGMYAGPPLYLGWTLSFEMWFYVAFALLLNFWTAAVVARFLPVIFFVGACVMTFYHGFWYLPHFLFHPFVLEFSFGCIVFQLQKKVLGRMSWFLLVSGAVYLLLFSRHTGYLGIHLPILNARTDLAWLRVLLWGVPSALMVAGLVGLERNYGYVLPRFLVWLGGISYSLYLTHMLAMARLTDFLNQFGLHNLYLLILLIGAFCIFIGWGCWRCIERPLTSRAQRWVRAFASSRAKHSAQPS
jgi:peptidoglycan/LPS O-acetylase OafA/YrhL